MKKLILLFMLCVPYYLLSQDIIMKINGGELKVKVFEIKPGQIDYYTFGQTPDSLRTIHVNEIFMIIYENGTKEVFNSKEKVDIIINDKDDVGNPMLNKKNIAIRILDERENKIIVGKEPSNLASGLGAIVQPNVEVKDDNQKIFGYAVKTLNTILKVKGFAENNSNYTLELRITDLYHRAEVGLYGAGGEITQNCSCLVTLTDGNIILFNKDFSSIHIDKTNDFTRQQDNLYKYYYSIRDNKEYKKAMKEDIKLYSNKGHFINYITVLNEIVEKLINDTDFNVLFKE